MKNKLFLLLVVLLVIPSALSIEPEEFGALADGLGLGPLVETIQPIFRTVSYVFGGIFGLYFLLLIARIHYERKKVKILKDIRYDLDRMNLSHGLRYSGERVGIIMGLFRKIIKRMEERGTRKGFAKMRKHKGKKK